MKDMRELEEARKRYKESREALVKQVDDEIRKMFNRLVPARGRADTVAGEIVRAINKIDYRCYNDGDHIGVRYGKEMANPAARYLMEKCNDEVISVIKDMWGIEPYSIYDRKLERLKLEVLLYLLDHPELETTKNEEDMWGYRDMEEDVDKGEWGDDW